METIAHRTHEQLVMLTRELALIAKHEDDLAADVAAHTPYWSPQPEEVGAHRAAARALREQADRLEALARSCMLAASPHAPVLC